MSQRQTSQTVTLEQALQQVLEAAAPLPAERVALSEAAGRRLARPVVAPFDLWPFERAAMDGYAVRAADLARSGQAPARLRVRGALYAGQLPEAALLPGEAVRIMTGAPLPPEADAVVPLEMAQAEGGGETGETVLVRRALPAGANVFPRGEEGRAGEELLAPGRVLTPGALGLLAALGLNEVEVHRRPVVALLAVGDELVEPGGARPGPGHIYDANTPALAAAMQAEGAEVVRLGIVPDDPAALARAIERGRSADLLVITGGASLGDRDFTLRALVDAGARVHFTRLLIKPGKTVAFARLGRCLAFALPGSPGAAGVAYHLLVVPALRSLGGAPDGEREHPRLMARLMGAVRVRAGRPHYLWGRLAFCGGTAAVWPVGPLSTAVVRTQAHANALIHVPAGRPAGPWSGERDGRVELDAGSAVEVVWLGTEAPQVAWPPVPVLGVVGPHAVGKTSLLERLVPELARRGIRAAAVKHDVHGFEMDREGKDTWRLSRCGAEPVGISGPGRCAALWNRTELSLGQLAARMAEGVQLVLAEGFRGEDVPRIELVPPGAAPQSPPEQLLAVVADGGLSADVGALADRIQVWLGQWQRRLAVAAGVPLR